MFLKTNQIFTFKDLLYVTILISGLFLGFLLFSKYIVSSVIAKSIGINFGFFFSVTTVIYFYLKHKNIPFSQFNLDKINLKWIFITILLAITITVFGALFSSILVKILKITNNSTLDLDGLLTGNFIIDYLHLKIFLGILIPFSEELYFRGILFNFIRQYKNFLISALISTGIFTFLHFTVGAIPLTLLLGFTSAYIYEKTNSLFYSFALHVAINTFALNFIIF